MSAWQLSKTAPHGLESVSRPRPKPAAGEILVRLRAASLNYRDLMAHRGQYGAYHPIVPLADGVGEVAELGPGVTGLRIGERVNNNYFSGWIEGDYSLERFATAPGAESRDGVLADYFVIPAAAAVPTPAHLTDPEAATLSCAGVTAWNALFVTGHIQPGDTVLLLGTGGVSLFALQFAKLAGARVIITSSDDTKLARARKLGADETINYKTTADWPEAVRALTDGQGADFAVDVAGGSMINAVVDSVRPAATVALIGLLAGFDGPVSTIKLLQKNVHLHAITVGPVAMFRAMNRAIAFHGLRPVVDEVFPFSDARAAYARLESGRHFGKLVIAR